MRLVLPRTKPTQPQPANLKQPCIWTHTIDTVLDRVTCFQSYPARVEWKDSY